MTKNAIIEEMFTGKNFNDCIKKMEPVHLQQDLKMEVALIVCEWPEEKLIRLHEKGELDFFVLRVILNQIQSSTSPFHIMYRRSMNDFSSEYYEKPEDHFLVTEERQMRQALEDVAMKEVSNLYWYDAQMLQLYIKLGTFRAIEAYTGIPLISCYNSVKKSLAILKTKVVPNDKNYN